MTGVWQSPRKHRKILALALEFEHCQHLFPGTLASHQNPRMIQIMPLAEPEPPKTKLGESFVRLVKATTTYVCVEIVKRFVPASFLRSLDDFKKGRVVSDDVALNTTPPKM